jgi:hypothetical protein
MLYQPNHKSTYFDYIQAFEAIAWSDNSFFIFETNWGHLCIYSGFEGLVLILYLFNFDLLLFFAAFLPILLSAYSLLRGTVAISFAFFCQEILSHFSAKLEDAVPMFYWRVSNSEMFCYCFCYTSSLISWHFP